MQSQQDLEPALRSATRQLSASIDSVSLAREAIFSFYQATAPLPLSNLAYWERVVRDEFSLQPSPSHFSHKVKWAKPGRFLTWVDLASWDGYVRERALRVLPSHAPNAFLFALAARRLNDWVPQVRQAARERMLAFAEDTDPEHVADALCAMLPMWTAWGRADQAEKQVMAQLAAHPPVTASLKQRIITATAGPMSAILCQVMRAAVLDEALVQIAGEAVQPAVRATAYRALLAGKATWLEGRQWQWTDVRYCQGRFEPVVGERLLGTTPPLGHTLELASTDRSFIVRRVAAEALIKEMGNLGRDIALPMARRFAADGAKPVAERGAFALQRLEARPT